MPEVEDETPPPLDPKTGQPLAGKALKKWRRQQKVQSDPTKAALAAKNEPEQKVAQEPIQPKTPIKVTINEVVEDLTSKESKNIENLKNSPTFEQPANSQNPAAAAEVQIPIDPKTGQPLAGKLLKKFLRAQRIQNDPTKAALKQENEGKQQAPASPVKPKQTSANQSKNQSNQHDNSRPRNLNSNSLQKPQNHRQNNSNSQSRQRNQKSENNQDSNQKNSNSQNAKSARDSSSSHPANNDIFKAIVKEHEFTENLPVKINEILNRSTHKFSQANFENPVNLQFLRSSIKITNNIHPAFISFGLYMANSKRFFSCNQETSISFCQALIRYVDSFDVSLYPKSRTFIGGMLKDFECQIAFLRQCTTFGIALGNIIRWFKKGLPYDPEIKRVDDEYSGRSLYLNKIREALSEKIKEFINGRIIRPVSKIQQNASTRILNELGKDDFIAIYKSDSLILKSLISHLNSHKNNRVRIWVMDDMSDPEGCYSYTRLKEIEENDESLTMKVYYSPISSINHCFKFSKIKTILIGCEGILQNGNVLAHAGTAIIGTMAKQYNVPMIVFCESYKFHEDIQTEPVKKNAIVSKELEVLDSTQQKKLATRANSNDGVSGHKQQTNRGQSNNPKFGQHKNNSSKDNVDKNKQVNPIKLNRVVFDTTDSKLVAAIVTEIHSGLLPMSSVPIILNEDDRKGL